MKPEEKLKAIELRMQGYSYSEILKEVTVSKGTLNAWFRELPFDEEEKRKFANNVRITRPLSRENGRMMKDKWDVEKQSVLDSYSPPIDDPKFMLGLGLYWGEGNKTSGVRMTNSDPAILRVFISWVREFFKDNARFSIYVHHYRPEDDEEIKLYWSEQLDLDSTCFRKSQFVASKTSLRKRNTLLYGTAKVCLLGKDCWMTRQKIKKTMTALSANGRLLDSQSRNVGFESH